MQSKKTQKSNAMQTARKIDSMHVEKMPDWRQIREDLVNAAQEHTAAEIAYVEAGHARSAAEQAEQEAAQKLTAAAKRHEQARARAGIAS